MEGRPALEDAVLVDDRDRDVRARQPGVDLFEQIGVLAVVVLADVLATIEGHVERRLTADDVPDRPRVVVRVAGIVGPRHVLRPGRRVAALALTGENVNGLSGSPYSGSGVPSSVSNAPTLNSIGPAPTAVSAKPVMAVAVVAICHEFMPTILAKVFVRRVDVDRDLGAGRGVDRDVDSHAADAVLVAVDTGRLLAAATAAASRVSGWS